MTFFSRAVSNALSETVLNIDVSFLCGATRVGKTTLAKQMFPEFDYLDLGDTTLYKAATEDPVGFAQCLSNTVVVDDIQRFPGLISALYQESKLRDQENSFLLVSSVDVDLLSELSGVVIEPQQAVYLEPASDLEKRPFKKEVLTEDQDTSNSQSLFYDLINSNISVYSSGPIRQVEGISNRILEGGFIEPISRTAIGAQRWFSKFVSEKSFQAAKQLIKVRESEELMTLLQRLSDRTASLLNNHALAVDLGVSRVTAEKYTKLLEQSFLIRRLPAWSGGSQRVIKTPKVHVIDSGLECYLRKVKEKDWANPRNDFSEVFESYVVQQLIAQSRAYSDGFTFSHYRDKDQSEVALVIEQDNKVWGVEVKKSASALSRDGSGLKKLAEQAGSAWQGGLLVYTGNQCDLLDERLKCYRIPVDRLW